jgi:hypothetical protein
MRIEFELPDDIAQALQSTDLSRTALEAIALEGYRSRRLGNGQVRMLLNFATPMQVHAFLKEHDVYLNYSQQELERDLVELDRTNNDIPRLDKRSA